MKKAIAALSISIALGLTGCGDKANTQVNESDAAIASSSSQQQMAEQAYLTLVDNYFKEQLALEPIYATFVGVNDYNDQFGDGLSDEYLKKRHDLNNNYLRDVKKLTAANYHMI